MHTLDRDAFLPEVGDDALARALIEGLDLPLSALRAALEGLARDFEGDPRAVRLADAIEEVNRAGRTVQDLVDFTAPPEPLPLSCSIEEILAGARERLPAPMRERVLLARGDRGHKLHVDGPLLARTLFRLLEFGARSSSGHVLVSVRRDCGATLFTTVIHADRDCATEHEPVAERRRRGHSALGLSIARRDLERMGGSLKLTDTPRGETVLVAKVPDAEAPQGSERHG